MTEITFCGITYRRNNEGDWLEMVDEYRNRMTSQLEQDMLDEIIRLRTAGDALAKSLAEFNDPEDELRLLAWQEARRA
jgi:hypothetical protein